MVSCWRFYDSGKRTLCSSTKTFVASALASRLPDGNLQRSLVHHGDVVIVFPPEVGELAVLAGIVALVFQCRATDTPVKGVADEPREFEGGRSPMSMATSLACMSSAMSSANATRL